ncbi:pyridoxal phosphate-dependent aminotransferase [Pararhizobium mangrovi]
MDVLARANQRAAAGRPVISMAVGQPAHPAPLTARRAAQLALEAGKIGYTDAFGRADLKAAIAAYYLGRHGVEVAPDRIAVTTGSSAGFNLAFLSMFNPGDRIAITRPGYPAYRNILAALELEAVEIPVNENSDFTLRPDLLEAEQRRIGRIAGVLLASPANPTGTVTGRDALEALAGYCSSNDIAFISDEIYHGLTFAGEETSALELTDEAIVVNSFSKYYCMTGWRIGWMVLPETLIRPMERVAQSLYICAPELSQIAAMAAFDGTDELDAVRAGYAKNRALLSERLPAIGLEIASPMDGAFYAYADITRYADDSLAFAERMLEAIDVAATPGLDFDLVDGCGTMRFSYAGATEDMAEALDRMERWLT